MIIEKEVIVPARKESKTVRKTYVCDICKAKFSNPLHQCTICGKDLCSGFNPPCTKYDPREYGDYPARYCFKCYDIKFVKYDKEYKQVEQDYENATDALDSRIKEECLKQ